MAAITLLPILACGGCILEYALRPKSKHAQAVEERDVAAQQFALPHLKRFGIESLNDDAFTITAEGEILLIATGLDSAGKKHDVRVFIRGTHPASIADWKLRRIDLDGEIGVNENE